MREMISIIIPSYNSSDYIEDCLKSVLNQTYKNMEIIIVDGGSKDNTAMVVDKYKNENNLKSSLKFYDSKRYLGISEARNIGIKASIGEFISFLDSDDIWYPRKLEITMDVFNKNPEVDLVCHNEYLVENGKIVQGLEYSKKVVNLDLKNKELVYRKLFLGNFLSPSAVTMRKYCLKNELFDETLKGAEDYDLWLRLARQYRFYLLPDFLGEFRRVSATSSSSDLHRLVTGYINVTAKNKAYVGRIYYYIKMLHNYFIFLKRSLRNIKPP